MSKKETTNPKIHNIFPFTIDGKTCKISEMGLCSQLYGKGGQSIWQDHSAEAEAEDPMAEDPVPLADPTVADPVPLAGFVPVPEEAPQEE